MKSCEDCGCRIYEYGCVNCNEITYIEMQETHDESKEYPTMDEFPMPKGGVK